MNFMVNFGNPETIDLSANSTHRSFRERALLSNANNTGQERGITTAEKTSHIDGHLDPIPPFLSV